MTDRSENLAIVVISGDRDGQSLFAIVNVKLLRMEERPPIWRVAANVSNKEWRTADKRLSCSLKMGVVLTNPRRKNWPCYETDTFALGQD
jgi:hypothetical protein